MLHVGILLLLVLTTVPLHGSPIVFWHSEGQRGGTTVLALGGGLTNTSIELCSLSSSSNTSTLDDCSNATKVLDSWDGAVTFYLPLRNKQHTTSHKFRACTSHTSCSNWRSLNVPVVWWAQGDASSAGQTTTATANSGWLKVYGRSLGFNLDGECMPSTITNVGPAVGTTAVLVNVQSTERTEEGTRCVLKTLAASCYDATFALPKCATPGTWTLQLQAFSTNAPIGGLMDSSFGGQSVSVTIIDSQPWPVSHFPVIAGGDIAAAVAAANTAGGGVVALGPGVFELGNSSLQLGNNVQLIGAGTTGSGNTSTVLHWNLPTTLPLFSNLQVSNILSGETLPVLPVPGRPGRYLLENFAVIVGASNEGYVVDIAGTGVVVRGIKVEMNHNLTGSASIFHTHGTAFSITGCNATHDNINCTTSSYPQDCLLFFDEGTDGGYIANNDFQMGCCAFEGYAASGILLEDNRMTDLPWAVQPDGNGFSTFGAQRVAERISFSRNMYQGMFNGTNIQDGSYPHEAFTSDGNGGAYSGRVKAANGLTVTVGAPAQKGWVGAAMAVLDGAGAGQVRRIIAGEADIYTVDRLWDVSLDMTSQISVVPYVGKVLMQGNNIRNSTTVQIFGCGFDSVYAGNTLTHMYSTKTIHPGGLFVFALDYGFLQPNFGFELIGNTLDDTHGLGILLDGYSGNLTLSRGHVVRNNFVRNKINPPVTGIPLYVDISNAITINAPYGDTWHSPKGSISDVVVEGNVVYIRSGNGTCKENGVFVSALHGVVLNNTCKVL